MNDPGEVLPLPDRPTLEGAAPPVLHLIDITTSSDLPVAIAVGGRKLPHVVMVAVIVGTLGRDATIAALHALVGLGGMCEEVADCIAQHLDGRPHERLEVFVQGVDCFPAQRDGAHDGAAAPTG
jgi:hypothetical protein